MQYLNESKAQAKYKQDKFDVQWYWMATHPMNIVHITHDLNGLSSINQAIQYHWIVDSSPTYMELEVLLGSAMSVQ